MSFDTRRIVTAAGEDVVKVYDKSESRHWDCGAPEGDQSSGQGAHLVIDRVRLREGYLVGGRRDGTVGVWSV